jgi:hypothetical protein
LRYLDAAIKEIVDNAAAKVDAYRAAKVYYAGLVESVETVSCSMGYVKVIVDSFQQIPPGVRYHEATFGDPPRQVWVYYLDLGHQSVQAVMTTYATTATSAYNTYGLKSVTDQREADAKQDIEENEDNNVIAPAPALLRDFSFGMILVA